MPCPSFRFCFCIPLLLVGLSLACRGADTSAAGQISLRDALVTTLKQSPAVRVQEAAIEQKSGVADQASGLFDWTGTGGINVVKERTPTLGAPGTEPVDASTQTSYSAGVGKIFRNGISVRPSVGAVVTRDNPATTPLGAPSAAGTSQLNLQIDVPLLRGLGVDDTGAVEAAARGDVKVARLLYQQSLAYQAFATAASYWTCRAADEVFIVQRDQEVAAERLVESTKVLVDARVFPPAFLLQANANLAAQRTVRTKAELLAKSARITLGQAIGLGPEQIVATPAPTDAFPAVGASISPDAGRRASLVGRALQFRADYLASQASAVPLDILARQAVLELKPRLDLSVNAGYRGLSTGPDLVAPLNHRLTGANGGIGLTMAWPFKNTYQRGLLRERRADLRVAQAQTEALGQQIGSQVLIALEQVRLGADAVRSGQEAVEIARRAIGAQNERLRSGEGTVLDLISLQNLSASARISLINDEAAYATAVAQLRFALGQIFDQPDATNSPFALGDLAAVPSL
jgi:outer membrane protein